MAVKLEGPLTKWTNVVQGWQYRWFVLDEYTGLLSYYTSKDKMIRGARRGCLRLKGGKIGISDEDDSTFTITCDHRTFHFQAQDAEERLKWVKALEETISYHTPGNLFGSANGLAVPTEEELNRRMQEAEAYFRILTQQVKTLEAQINHSQSANSEKSMLLKDSLTQMIETMGQTIELLHDAKSSLAKKVPVPIIATKPGSTTPKLLHQNKHISTSDKSIDKSSSSGSGSGSGSSSARSTKSEVSINNSQESTDIKEINDQVDEVAFEETETVNKEESKIALDTASSTVNNDNNYVNILRPNEAAQPLPMVPINSYTSSDEEDIDEFFDANEQFGEITIEDIEKSLKEEEATLFKRKISANEIIDLNVVESQEKLLNTQNQEELRSHQLGNVKTQDDEFDGEDEDDDADESADMAQHGSVITHLLSQVRIGMDLTKVTLPTFILERRSLLEMYSAFFAHPDLFKGIPDFADPGDRMVQVLRWYLSSFHAGRKGSVAKKPYNPILGETFQCFYNMTEDKNLQNQPDNLSSNGPIPWCTKEDVSFIAEQVSHHPPISAFYAECESKRICFNSHLWTKSKFLGLSIGVHMVGTGNVYVSDFNEEYVMTFPNGYGRSILTVPWVEMGGKTEITCQQTGYSVQLDFLTKPFYGGKRNRITADVYAPNQKKPFMSVNGEWNGVMHAKYADRKETEVFVDTYTMPTVNRKVKKIEHQEDFESRRMWRDVTISLKKSLIEDATAGKHKLEEKQRQDARVRKETNTKWNTRLFDEWEEGEDRKFFYKWPLYKRLNLPKPGV